MMMKLAMPPSFQQKKFCFDNGYDLPDPKYLSWLRVDYPIAASVLSEKVTTDLCKGHSVTPVNINLQSVIESSPVTEKILLLRTLLVLRTLLHIQ